MIWGFTPMLHGCIPANSQASCSACRGIARQQENPQQDAKPEGTWQQTRYCRFQIAHQLAQYHPERHRESSKAEHVKELKRVPEADRGALPRWRLPGNAEYHALVERADPKQHD